MDEIGGWRWGLQRVFREIVVQKVKSDRINIKKIKFNKEGYK